VARELSTFRPLFKQMHMLVSVDDLLPSHNEGQFTAMTLDQDDKLEPDTTDDSLNSWASYSFIKPLRAIMELSGFSTLTWLFKILETLAVTSSSAERAMSRVKIIKNRLRSSMLDDWFSSLMILASERDILEAISADNIIDSFASNSVPLQKLLLLK
jgi:hypothetical protein